MSKLSAEIIKNQVSPLINTNNKDAKKALTQSLLDSISGGWINAYANWDKKF